jgi:hypothetical protein
MKRIALLLALFCLGLTMASFAVAKDGPGKGKGKKSSTTSSTTSSDPVTCHPKISAILKGTFVSGGGTSFTMDVTRSNFHAKELVGEPLTIMVDTKTKFRRNGHAELSDFEAGDRLNVQARTCKVKKQKNKNSTTSTTTTTTTGSTPAPAVTAPAMLAKRVVGQPAKASAATTTTTTTPAP